MDKPGPLTAQIAASIEDVKTLLDDNRSLSVAFLSRRQTDFEEEMRKRLDGIEKQLAQLAKRINAAGAAYKELRAKVDGLGTKGGA